MDSVNLQAAKQCSKIRIVFYFSENNYRLNFRAHS